MAVVFFTHYKRKEINFTIFNPQAPEPPTLPCPTWRLWCPTSPRWPRSEEEETTGPELAGEEAESSASPRGPGTSTGAGPGGGRSPSSHVPTGRPVRERKMDFVLCA